MPTTRPWPSNPVATRSPPTKVFYASPDCAPAIHSAKPCKPMPRKGRFYLPNISAHLMQRGHNWEPVFFATQDYLEYRKILKRVADACHCAIHAYVLMTNHIHLLLTPATGDAISRLFQECGRQYVGYINHTSPFKVAQLLYTLGLLHYRHLRRPLCSVKCLRVLLIAAPSR